MDWRLVAVAFVGVAAAQGGAPAETPAVTVRGQTYTPRSILARNMGTDADQTTAFPPHKVIGNVFYVGTRTLSSFLIATPAGHILINSTYERNVRTIAKSVEQLGFRFSDVRILLGTHAHGDHQEGDALVKALTGAQVMMMSEDVPALEAMRPDGRAHPIDRMLRDGEDVALGGTTLVAHLTPGHTRGCTTWTMKAAEAGRTYDVVLACSYRAPGVVTPAIEAEFSRTFSLLRTLPCDVPLGDHPSQYNMAAKHARLAAGGPNPVVDPASCWHEAEIQEAMLRAQLDEQRKAAVKKTAVDPKRVAAERREYLASLPPGVRARMHEIRNIVRVLAPEAIEVFSYRIPGFALDGKPLVWYAAFTHHISLYPMTASIRRAHAAALKGYKTSTGTVQFPLDKALPVALVKRLVTARLADCR